MLLATQKHNQIIKQHTHVGFWLIKAIMNKRDSLQPLQTSFICRMGRAVFTVG